MYETFENLLKKMGVTVADVCKATRISSSTMTDWKKGRYESKADKLQRIADYFGVSLSYLMTGETGDYYLNPETARIAQEVFDNKDMRILFEAARNSRPENLLLAAELLERLKKTNDE